MNGDNDKLVEKAAPAGHQSSDNAAHKLLDGARDGQWLKGYDPTMTSTLQADGVLPAAEVFDPIKVKQHLNADLQADKDAGNALSKLHEKNAAAKTTIDADRANDSAVQNDFNRVNGALHEMSKKTHNGVDGNPEKSTVTKGDLQALIKQGAPEVQAAAKRLLDGWDKNADFTSASAEPDSPAALRNKTEPFMNANTVTRGMHRHEHARSGAEADLNKSSISEQQAIVNQAKLEKVIKDEQQSLTGGDKFFAATHIHKAEGYYQAASRLLDLDGKVHQESERKQLTKLLQEQVAERHGGKLPKFLTTRDLDLSQDNVDKLFSRMKELDGK